MRDVPFGELSEEEQNRFENTIMNSGMSLEATERVFMRLLFGWTTKASVQHPHIPDACYGCNPHRVMTECKKPCWSCK